MKFLGFDLSRFFGGDSIPELRSDDPARMNVLGNRVFFRRHGTTRSFVECPENYWIVVDRLGKYWSKCNIGICPAVTDTQIERDRGRSGNIYLDVGHLCDCGGEELPSHIVMPWGPWQSVALVDQILYDRPDVGPMVHDYAVPVTLYRKRGDGAFCVSLPNGCVVDKRGFVKP